MYSLMSNIKFHKKIPLGRSPFLRYHVFWCILLVTGLVTDLKHRVMIMLWKIFVGLTYHIVIFNADIMNFMTCALFPVVFREILMFLSNFFAILSKNNTWEHIFGRVYSSRQQKLIGDESFLMFSQWLKFLPCHMTVDGQVLRFMCDFLPIGTRK